MLHREARRHKRKAKRACRKAVNRVVRLLSVPRFSDSMFNQAIVVDYLPTGHQTVVSLASVMHDHIQQGAKKYRVREDQGGQLPTAVQRLLFGIGLTQKMKARDEQT